MKVTVGNIKKRKIILLNFIILLFVVWWLGIFFIMYKHFYEKIMFFGVLIVILLSIYSFVLPGLAFANTMWEVDQNYLRYIYFDKNLDKATLKIMLMYLKFNLIDGRFPTNNNEIIISEHIIENAKVNYNQATNKIVLAGTEFLYEQYQTKIASLGYNSVDSNFVNKKALASDMIVAKKENGLIGIIRPDGQEIAGARYESVQWLETTDEFLVESNDKYGIISELGQSKISMNYDSIKLLDKNAGLYIVKSSDKYGVINKSERQILYSEYDQIGVNKDQYPSLKNENQYLFYDSIIPVQRDEKWGLFNVSGEMILPIEYDSIGCIVSSQQTKSANNAVLLDDYEGIIVGKQLSENDRNKKYAVYNPLGEQLVGFVLDNIYYRTENGKDVYYLEMNGQQGNLDEVFKANGIKKVNTNINDSNLNNNMNINNGTSDTNELVKN